VNPAEEIKRLLQECTLDERRAIFWHLRQEFGIHPLEEQLNATAEVILRALARASDLTIRGVRGIIAELAFITEVIAPGPTSRWQDVTPPGNHSFDFRLKDSAGYENVPLGAPPLPMGYGSVTAQLTGSDILP
jgi:hypothetical protein